MDVLFRTLGLVALGVVAFFVGFGSLFAALNESVWPGALAAAGAALAVVTMGRLAGGVVPAAKWLAVPAGVALFYVVALAPTLRWLMEPKTPAVVAKPSPEQVRANMIILGEQAVRGSLKDEDSAKFRNQFVSAAGAPCGEVNSKNSFGAYAGFKRYAVASTSVVAIEGESMTARDFEEVWAKVCARAK